MCTKALFFYVWLECPEPYFKYTQEPLNVYSELMRVKGIKLYRTPVLDETGKQRVLEKTMRSFILLLGEAEIKENEEEMSDLDCRILVLKNRLEREGKNSQSVIRRLTIITESCEVQKIQYVRL